MSSGIIRKRIISSIGILILVLIVVPVFDAGLSNCVLPSCSEYQWGYTDREFDHYEVNANHVTPSGTMYDPSGQNISPELIDRLTNEVENCLEQTQITDKIAQESSCNNKNFSLPLDRKSFVVIIPNDYTLNCDKTQEVLPVMADPSGCLAKGEQPTLECPCRWRAGIKCPNILITTPNFYLYKDVLIRFTTGCQNPWGSPELSKCATPSTTPLSDGSDPNNGL